MPTFGGCSGSKRCTWRVRVSKKRSSSSPGVGPVSVTPRSWPTTTSVKRNTPLRRESAHRRRSGGLDGDLLVAAEDEVVAVDRLLGELQRREPAGQGPEDLLALEAGQG